MIDIEKLAEAVEDATDHGLASLAEGGPVGTVLMLALAEAHDEGKRMVLAMTGIADVNWPNPYRSEP